MSFSSSSATVRYHESFNAKLEEFIKELATAFPEIKDLRTLKTSFMLAKNMNSKLPQQLFKMYVSDKFGDQITARDEGFFLGHDYRDILNDAKSSIIAGFDPSSVDIVGQLKSVWKDMSSDNKDAVWKYLTVLMYLSEKC